MTGGDISSSPSWCKVPTTWRHSLVSCFTSNSYNVNSWCINLYVSWNLIDPFEVDEMRELRKLMKDEFNSRFVHLQVGRVHRHALLHWEEETSHLPLNPCLAAFPAPQLQELLYISHPRFVLSGKYKSIWRSNQPVNSTSISKFFHKLKQYKVFM